MARSVIHEDARDDVDTEPVMRDIAGAVAGDARRLVRRGKTGRPSMARTRAPRTTVRRGAARGSSWTRMAGRLRRWSSSEETS
jgi:hypothetical protein